MQCEKYISSKIMQKMRQEDEFQISCFQKALNKVEASGQHFSLNMFWQTFTWIYNKNKLQNFRLLIQRLLIQILCMIFQEKSFSYYILLTNQISLSGGCLYFLGSMCIIIISFPVCDVINFKIKLRFLTKPFYRAFFKSA